MKSIMIYFTNDHEILVKVEDYNRFVQDLRCGWCFELGKYVINPRNVVYTMIRE